MEATMADINTWVFSGRLTKDCEMKTVGQNGTNLVKFCVALNVGYGDKKHSLFVNVNLWGKLGMSIAQYLVKGKTVAVTAPVDLNKWVSSQDGQTHTDLQVDAKEVTLMQDAAPKQEHVQAVVEEVPEGEMPTF